MTRLGLLGEAIRKALLIATPVVMLAACSGDDGSDGADGAAGADGSPGADGVSAAVNVEGVVLDGPVMGGTIFVFPASTVDAAVAAANAATDRAAELANQNPIATIERNVADGKYYEVDIPAEYAGEAIFFVFDSVGAEDMTFADQPFNMESVAMVGGAGTNQQVNITPQTTMIAQLVRDSLDPENDGTVLTASEIESLVASLTTSIVSATPELPEGSDPISGLDADLLEVASTAVGEAVRGADGLLELTMDETLSAYAADAADGIIDGAAPASLGLSDEQAEVVALLDDIEPLIEAGVQELDEPTSIRSPLHSAAQHMALASGLSVDYLTREAGHHADQFSWYPLDNPTHQIWCIENGAEVIEPVSGKLNPGVQRISLADGTVETIIRGMARCDGLRTTPWGTILATEETGDGAAYEIMNPLTTTNLSITARGGAGEAATIVDAEGNATDLAVKRTELPTMAWEGLFVLANGVVVGGDELRPGSYPLILEDEATETDVSFGSDTDGGAIFKFIPSELHDGSVITSLDESPLVAGNTWAMQVKCSSKQFGQGCEVGEAAWVSVDPDNARVEANIAGATGYYRPEDMHLDPTYSDSENADAVRYCWANTGNRGAQNWGEVMCAIDSDPAEKDGDATDHDTVVYRFLEGDSELNAPDNLAFQPNTGILYVIEDNRYGDIWACLPDGDDQGLTSDGCVRILSLNDRSAEPSGFAFNNEGTEAWVSIQHSSDSAFPLVDDFRTDDIVHITGFSTPTADADDRTATASADSTAIYGFGTPLTASNEETIDREAEIEAEVGVDTEPANAFGYGEDASDYLALAEGLTATFLTRTASEWWDQHDFYPNGDNPTHLIGCIEETRGLVDDGTDNKFKPSVQRVSLEDGTVETILRGISRCDGIRTTAWGTILATEETGDGAAYEILDPLTTTNVVVAYRGGPGEAALIVQGDDNGVFEGTEEAPTSPDATDQVVKRTALVTMAWEGLYVLPNGIVVGGDELRPGSYEQNFLANGTRDDEDDGTAVLTNRDSNGGAIFKFIPSTPRTSASEISDLDDSPLVAGSNYAMQVSCRDSRQQVGQGCEVGNAAWVEIDGNDARVAANDAGATGYYRPEDLHLDPTYVADAETPDAVRFCWTNTGNSSVENGGEVICGVDYYPMVASDERTVVVNRFVEGDGDFAAPDNLEFQPVTGMVYVIEDRSNGDVWACLPDGADRDIKTDGCVKMLSIAVQGAEPTGFMFTPDGKTAYVSIQHAGGTVLFDGNDTDDLIKIEGFNTVLSNTTFGAEYEATLHSNSVALFGVEGPLAESSVFSQ